MDKSKSYINSYLGGVLLGLLLLATFYINGRGLGASGAIKDSVAATVNQLAPEHAKESKYIGKLLSDGEKPLNSWLVFEVLGILAGSFISGALAGRLKWKTEHSPKISIRTRILFAGMGGVLFGIGSQLARGCTSGAALSGSAALGLSGFITMLCIFGSAYMFAWFFRKLWI
ncbi:MAG: YeeE/YedE family protein [Haliscomenobacter sp.]|nr:YeeE/YedE family protein [Haliscomenobacter sp.]MBK8655861.1 YeeE/YedE family protein [Haliscomenobacter sp.]MBP9875131.1 YeeE/YedE family protein [Haliscomenobacter sp.]